MTVKLLNYTPLALAAMAARLCTGSDKKVRDIYYSCLPYNDGKEPISIDDMELLENHIVKKGKHDTLNPPHESVLEHLVYTFIADISRACLQEVSRHRIASPSVESTRYALKKILRKECNLVDFIYLTGDRDIDDLNIEHLENVVKLSKKGKSNDTLKYSIPECFMSREMLTINARSLRNFMLLRSSSRALDEIRRLAFDMYDVLPDEHKFVFEDRLSSRYNLRGKSQKELHDEWKQNENNGGK
jgi:thymidylate synthase (FAD)